MNQIQRNKIVSNIEDANLRNVAEKHPDCLHPCLWLVKGNDGPLEAGGRPRLPIGREWPRSRGKLLVYLLSIDTSLLPEWSPLLRNSGKLLLFVGHTTCEIVIVGPGVETFETDPPLEEYLSGDPTAGDVLEITRFRLEEGLHAGLPTSWSPADNQLPSLDDDLVEALAELSRALRPEDHFGRLFGFYEFWIDADAAAITRYSYFDVNGFPGGWYLNLTATVEKFQRQLEQANLQKPLTIERLPKIAESVVQACEKWAAVAENKIAATGLTKIEALRTTLARRQQRWQMVKTADSESANQALEDLVASAAQVDREIDGISNAQDKAVYYGLLALLTPMQYACRKDDCTAIRNTWNDYEDKLNECASQLTALQLSTALHWRLKGYESLTGWSQQSWIDPKAVAGKIEAIQWWQANVQKHEAQLAYWRPLLIMDSDGGPYFWGDAGWAIILADQREVANARLGQLAIAVDVS